MTSRRAGVTAIVAVAAALLVVVLAAWAATIGPSDVLRGEGIGPIAAPSESATAAEGTGDAEEMAHPDVEVHAWVRVVWLVLNIALAVLLVVLVVRYVVLPLVRRARARRLRRLAGADREPEFTVLEPPQRVARALLDDAAEQRRVLAEDGSPRNAVVECWSRFETAAAAAGMARHPWETSAEYTLRILDLVDAHEPAVTRLADLYREARFSEHELTEADRAAALAALDAIHRTIGVPA